MKKKILMIVGIVLGVVILVPVVALVITFSGNPRFQTAKTCWAGLG